MQTAELVFNHVFQYFGIPEDILSDWGPQFIAKVWKAFFTLLGVTLSLDTIPNRMGREIQEIGPILRTFCHVYQNSWNQFLGSSSLYQPAIELTLVHAQFPASFVPVVRETITCPIC